MGHEADADIQSHFESELVRTTSILGSLGMEGGSWSAPRKSSAGGHVPHLKVRTHERPARVG